MPSAFAVRMMRRAISPLLAMSRLSIIATSHPKEAETRPFGDRCIQAGGKSKAQHITRLARIDDAVVPETCSGVIGIALGLVAGADRRLEGFFIFDWPCLPACFHRI